uniref:TLC domain-containing protein n=1 Tax=Clastoptera arizonana TaxID=38151 RepID=A0A1B6CUI8_9HEMI
MTLNLDYSSSFNYGYIIVNFTTLLFFINNAYLLNAIIPLSATSNKHQEWKWRNIANSLIHSSVTGIGACISLYMTPEFHEDLISYWTPSAHCLIAFSIGYFIYDLIDMGLNDRKSKTFELMAHHTLVISCFFLSLSTYRYTGFTLMALLVEVNSIFLHIRQLMIIQCWSRQDHLYRLNNTFNLGTFVVFRILVMGWMTRWLLQNRDLLSLSAYRLGGLTLGVIMVMNIILFMRILKSDYQQCPQELVKVK